MALLSKIGQKTKEYAVLVMFRHTIFSFSFGIVSLLLTIHYSFSVEKFIICVLALLTARTGANGINRVIDAEIDKRNPRTSVRQIPKGQMSKKEALIFSLICLAFTPILASMLNPLALLLSPVALFFMIIYSYTKRFTPLCHLVLGFTVAMAPAGAWIAMTGTLSFTALFLAAANMFWVAGFDIIYGAQDYDFDTQNGIHSIPAYFGIAKGLKIAQLFHVIAFLSLVVVGFLTSQFHWIYFTGIAVIGMLFIIEHRVVKPNHLIHAEIASYNLNELVSIVFLTVGIIDTFI
ncbi:MAG: putative 4-hydroxybenzoate polyprenyltransferase [Streptococcaceae bacterium]|nr:putative 4-hydroxybenzoate polyprenyltransferase [Streptococcaceae bacterium]